METAGVVPIKDVRAANFMMRVDFSLLCMRKRGDYVLHNSDDVWRKYGLVSIRIYSLVWFN